MRRLQLSLLFALALAIGCASSGTRGSTVNSGGTGDTAVIIPVRLESVVQAPSAFQGLVLQVDTKTSSVAVLGPPRQALLADGDLVYLYTVRMPNGELRDAELRFDPATEVLVSIIVGF